MEALGPRGPDVVLGERLQHLGAHEAGKDRQKTRGQDKHRHHQVAQAVPDIPAGRRRWVRMPPAGSQRNPTAKNAMLSRPSQKVRDRVADHREHARRPGPASRRECTADHKLAGVPTNRPDQDRRTGVSSSVARYPFEDDVVRRQVSLKRAPEVKLDRPAEPFQVLDSAMG